MSTAVTVNKHNGNNQKKPEEQLRIDISNYELSLKAIQSFVSLLSWDKDADGIVQKADYSIGKKMKTSTGKEVTPDLLVNKNDWQTSYIAEIKSSIPAEADFQNRYYDQIIKYEDITKGWLDKEQNPKRICIVGLIDFMVSQVFADNFQSYCQKINHTPKKPISIIGYFQNDKQKEFMVLKKMWGEIYDEDIDRRLHDGYQMSMENLIAFWPNLKFYDAPPPIEHTMTILWLFVFPIYKDETNFDEETRTYLINTRLDELTTFLQKSYGSAGGPDGKVCYPQKQWVKDALMEFVNLDLARVIKEGSEFQIFYKNYDDPLNKFIALKRKAIKKSRQNNHPGQLSLPFSTEKD